MLTTIRQSKQCDWYTHHEEEGKNTAPAILFPSLFFLCRLFPFFLFSLIYSLLFKLPLLITFLFKAPFIPANSLYSNKIFCRCICYTGLAEFVFKCGFACRTRNS